MVCVCGVYSHATGSVPSDCWRLSNFEPRFLSYAVAPISPLLSIEYYVRTVLVWILGNKKQLRTMTMKDDFKPVMIRVLFREWGESATKVSNTETPIPVVGIQIVDL